MGIMKEKLLRLWSQVAKEVAQLSTCERLNVGCLVLSLDGERLLSFGYNGTYRGGPNKVVEDVPGNQYWVHAEANALVKTRPIEPFCVLTTHTPCYQCAMLLINAGTHCVLALDRYRDPHGWNLLRNESGSDTWDMKEFADAFSNNLPRGAFLLTEFRDDRRG